MGKKRQHSFKPFQASSKSTAEKKVVTVNEKLNQLRLESRAGRPVAASVLAHTDSGPPVPAHPEVASFLGLQYQAPRERVKARSRGHLAPNSWAVPPARREVWTRSINDVAKTRLRSLTSLSSLCLRCVRDNVNRMTGMGLCHLLPHLKERLLSCLDSRRISGLALQDIVPAEEPEIEHVDLLWLSHIPTAATSIVTDRDIVRLLHRLRSLHRISIDAHQLERYYSSLPRILEHMSIHNGQDATNLPSWCAIGTHFLALKKLTLHQPSKDLLERLATIDWDGAWRTIRRLYIALPASVSFSTSSASSGEFGAYLQAWATRVQSQRSRGHHLEVVFGA